MTLDKIFANHAVFPMNKTIRVYGTGDGAGEIYVTFAGITKKAQWSSERWQAEFTPMPSGGPYTLEVTFGTESIVREDIYVGRVFLFSGQSNMQVKLPMTSYPAEMYQGDDMIRLYSTDHFAKADHYTSEDGWVLCEAENLQYWSAIAYLASKFLREREDVAVGAVVAYQGASIIESWLPEGTLQTLGIDIPTEEKHIDHVYSIYSSWNTKDGTLYENVFMQIVPYSFSAVIWYQGESDTSVKEAEIYDKELCALIDIWREKLCDDELRFLVVQIADYAERRDEAWRGIQRAQANVAEMRSKVTTVICSDVCEDNDIHPKNKTDLSKRIADYLA